jgi:chemotaxis protein CheZ
MNGAGKCGDMAMACVQDNVRISVEGAAQVKQIGDAREFFDKRIGDVNDPRLVLFNDLVAFMDAIAISDYDGAEGAMQSIVRNSRGGLYNEVGKVTRRLHDAVWGFREGIDPKVRELATSDMPDAVDKLQFVISETEHAANKTMGIVEKYIQTMEGLGDHIGRVEGPAETIAYLRNFRCEFEDDLTAILTAQQFQDLTGQTIRKVIALVADIEHELVKLITTFSDATPDAVAAAPMGTPEVVSQADVDDLLKEFGF